MAMGIKRCLQDADSLVQEMQLQINRMDMAKLEGCAKGSHMDSQEGLQEQRKKRAPPKRHVQINTRALQFICTEG